MRKSILSTLLVLSSLVLAGCFWSKIKEGPIASGDTVFVTYTAKYEGESKVFDEKIVPVKIKIGQGEILPYIDTELLGMMRWETKDIMVNPENGFGREYNAELVKVLPAMYFTVGGQRVGKDTIVNLDGREWTVVSVQWEWDNQLLTIDLNPAYTWKNIEYSVMVQQIGWSEFQSQDTPVSQE